MVGNYKVPGTIAQSQYDNNQIYDIDILKIYQDFVVEIDKIRSNVSVQNNPSLQVISDVTTNAAPTNIKVDNVPQESRCHAFYRLLGLPVTDGSSLYSPGFDRPNNSNTNIINNKLTIAKNLFNNQTVATLFNTRETIPRQYLSLFQQQSVDAMVLAMSLAEIRPFTAPLKNVSGILDTNLNHQSYPANLASRLTNTVVNNNERATKVNNQRQHILIPFAVDPRIDFNVYPKRNTIAVPFLKDKIETKITDNVFLKRPYIEKVCRDRFSSVDNTPAYGTQVADIITSIKQNQYFTNNQLIQSVFNPSDITSEAIQFANYFNAIRSTLNQLYAAINTVKVVLAADPNSNGAALYNWTPIPSISGPEKGSTTRDLFSGQSNDPSNTANDLRIINLLYQQTITNISNKLTTLQTADVGGFAFDGIELTPDQNSSTALGSTFTSPIDASQSTRKARTDAANNAIQTIEIIMGEFSGLGLLDIFVISSAFWVLDKSYLISLVDTTAVNRMINNANLQDPIVLQAKNEPIHGATEAIQAFQDKVLEIYQIVDQLWTQIQKQNTQ